MWLKIAGDQESGRGFLRRQAKSPQWSLEKGCVQVQKKTNGHERWRDGISQKGSGPMDRYQFFFAPAALVGESCKELSRFSEINLAKIVEKCQWYQMSVTGLVKKYIFIFLLIY
jgi:hypothetical protein